MTRAGPRGLVEGPAAPLVHLAGSDESGARALGTALAGPLRAGGFRTAVHAGPDAALRWLDEPGSGPVAVVVRLRVADLRGLAMCRTLRRVAPWLVIVAVTGGDARDVVMALEAGADDCVVSPVHPAELIARLRAHLRRRGTPAGIPPQRCG